MSIPTGPPATHRWFVAASAIGIAGWAFILLLLGWWYLAPVALPTVTQPLPILNPGHRVAIGEPILMELSVVKPVPLDTAASSRWIACESGNLVTLTSTPTNLPVGTYTIVSDSVILPAKVSPGDVCRMNYLITYSINPVRDEQLALESEPFTVAKGTP